MKKTSLLAVLPALALTMPALQSAALAAPESPAAVGAEQNETVGVAVTAPDEADANAVITLNFTEPMVAPEKVGTDADKKLLSLSQALPFDAVWVSTSSLRITLKEAAAPVSVLHVALNADGLRSLAGHPVQAGEVLIPEHTYLYMHSSYSAEPGEPIFFSAGYEKYDAPVAAAVSKAYWVRERYENGRSVELERTPATVVPLTVGEALKHWDSYVQATGWAVDKEDRKALELRDPAEVLPYLWCAKPYDGTATVRESVRLCLPGIGNYDTDDNCYKEAVVGSVSHPDFEYMMSNTRLGENDYRVAIEFTQPIPAAEAEACLRNLPFHILTMRKGEETKPLSMEADGAYHGGTDYSSIVLTPLTEETMATAAPCKTADGEVQGVKALYFRAKVTGERLRLSMNRSFTSVHGAEITESALKYYGNQDRDYTVLAPKRPYIHSDMLSNNMDRSGACVLRCKYRSLNNMKVRVHRVEADSPQAALVLGKYLEKYTPATDSYRFTWDGRHSDEVSAMPEELWTLMPHEEKTIELPDEEGETEIDLKKLFGAETQGLFVVDASGDTHPEWQAGGKEYNQGLIQVTNLGLMWKVSGKSLFAYAYHLSDGKPVADAKLRLLDKNGKTLAELPVKDGMVNTTLPAGLAFMQLAEGKDCYTTTATARDCDISADRYYYYMDEDENAVPADLLPKPLIFLFSDRNVYRPGETAHVKGMLRFLTGNELSNPGLESVKLTATIGREETVVEAAVAADGSFSADIPLAQGGSCCIEAVCEVKGDADGTSPDHAVLKSYAVDKENYLWNRAKYGRQESLYVTVTDFRRNAFEVESAVTVNEKEHTATVNATATNLTGAPVAQGKVEWRTRIAEGNFYPEQFSNYYFGNYCDSSARESFYDRYYGGGSTDYTHTNTMISEGALDDEGRGSCTVGLRSSDFPSPTQITTYTSVTDGNEQTIKNSATATWHPCSVYAGISSGDSFCPAGGTMKFKTLLVGADENIYTGAPCKAKLTVKRKAVHNYRYGAKAKTNVHSSSEWVTVEERDIQLTGKPQELSVPAAEAGEYVLDIAGTDAEGKRFRTAVTRYVWGSDESPWEVESGTEMRLITSDDVYEPGKTAKVLVLTPVDGEVLITMERGGVLRSFRRTVTVDNPVVEIPVTDEDAPVVYVSAFLVQTGDKNRSSDGMPLQKLGTAELHVLPVRNTLKVELEVPKDTQRPGQDCTVGGVVKDADGKPVANASVTLFAEDEGVLQVIGYDVPDPLGCFMADRVHGVTSYSSLNQLLGENLAKRDFGNKGVFIGGGDDEEEDEGGNTGRVREDFAPCALWLADVKTDAQGHFTATFKNPDTLTRYRLMAVTAAGADRFGNGKASYLVDSPVRVEPSAPLTAVVGDELLLPATVSMSVKDLPAAANGAPLTWNVTLSGTPNAKLPQPTTAVTLAGAAPKTVLQPVTLTETGDCKLTWRVQGTGAASKESDAAAFSFTVRPPMPFLREAVCATIDPGKAPRLANWVKGDFAKDTATELTFSTSPLSGAADGLRYLITYPHGCVEQLSSALLPWLFKDEFEKAVGLRYPQGRNAQKVVSETLEKIKSRQLGNGFFTYWDGGKANRNFSPYAALVLAESHTPWRQADAVRALRGELLEVADANLVGLYFLARVNCLDAKVFDEVRKLRVKPNETELWLLAACAEIIHHPAAADLVTQARKAKGTGGFRYGLPSATAAETLWAVEKAPHSSATAVQLRRYVESVALNSPTTWECGWLCLAMHRYIQRAELSNKTATINGQPVSMEAPLRLTAKVGDATAFKAAGNPVYVSATVEGYTAKKQPEKMVDKGFAVTRRYEKLNADGSWTPTGVFQVGDVVRVTLTAKHTDGLPAVYMVLEDRLPAAFEAVNPKLTTQGLPDCVVRDEYSWSGSGFINNREYLKDCVRFYVTRWGNGDLTARYIARVVKSGKVTAPAAKAELMYRPQVYGLAIPQHFTVKPR